eukprot:6440224-Prymnesium_polylepis.2
MLQFALMWVTEEVKPVIPPALLEEIEEVREMAVVVVVVAVAHLPPPHLPPPTTTTTTTPTITDDHHHHDAYQVGEENLSKKSVKDMHALMSKSFKSMSHIDGFKVQPSEEELLLANAPPPPPPPWAPP